MKKNMITFIIVLVLLFGALAFVVSYQNQQQSEGNPYGKSSLEQGTIDQLNDPLYQNQILPNELEERLENNEDVTVYFYSPDCIHCQNTTPLIVPMTEGLEIDLKKLNLLEFEGAWNTFNIESTPTIVHYENGEEVARINGARPIIEFDNFFNEHVLDSDSSAETDSE
ncbi:thiol reductase thioredoxin [Aquibacillus halophilus]|uniref:Thiol reductase thioredoxin n=1 Tax=Aquibacillus halophilus TaxID=930132 RepID=A0A6A8DEM1_9BACI|nr:thioredoxin family protein [Aquibacillus halophilus]MRH44145.1 thiol reductase thioredoxin [Aquibacillus halophilus]